MIEEWNLASTNHHRLAGRRYEVAVIPVGAVEPHNRHLPEGQDWLQVTHIAHRCCREAWARCPKVLCLPTIPYGVDCNLMDFPLTMHVRQATLDAMLRDLIASLVHHGIPKVLILNGHGGNDFMPLVRQVQCEMDVHVFLCDWWKVARDRYDEIFQADDNHGGEMETSIAMALYPELVEMQAAGDGQTRPFRLEGLREGWVQTSRTFSKLSDQCGVGDPSAASAEKGARYLDLTCQRITAFLTELAASQIDKLFPQAL